ncbi:MAG TPA: hypothetical protein VF538_15545 [Pyrinomonadaceae bacterium]
MTVLKHNAVSGRAWRWQRPRLLLSVCAACAAAAVFAAALFLRRPAPAVVETVTTGLDRPAPAAKPSPIASAPQLPARDEDVEKAGDKIAEATVYLSRRQRPAALRALTEARAAARRAYDRRAQQRDPASHKLLSALRELELAEVAVERGSLPDARQRLLALNQRLDQVGQ